MLEIYNSLTRLKETFKPLHEGHVGMYVCGPTVYGDAHLGHARPAITFDLLYRYLQYLGYKVRYVRNITDVGHLEHDADEGEDKIAKKARLEQLEPMEVVQYYTNRYHRDMAALNVLPPSIEPHASGHIIEQIAFVQKILDKGYAYVSNGSVYMDVEKYAKDYPYGKLTVMISPFGRKLRRSISCIGLHHGLKVFRAGTWSALPWVRNTSVSSSISTAVVWISSSRITRRRSRRVVRPSGKRACITGCIIT